MSAIVYLGVDIAGGDNTWVAALTTTGDGHPQICLEPSVKSLADIREYCVSHHVGAVAVDAQLTLSIADERGFRASDIRLRELLPASFRNWVASFNSLMAVPVRGQLLAAALSPLVATILETHPRVCLYAALERAELADLEQYKTGPDTSGAVSRLWAAWAEAFSMATGPRVSSDGALDAVVCATIAWLFHRSPESLFRLASTSRESIGRGPFYVYRHSTWSPGKAVSPDQETAPARYATRDSTLATEHRSKVSYHEAPSVTDTIQDTEGRTYEELRGRRVVCPACRQHEFTNWPWGWDAHAAYTCSGVSGTSTEARKEGYRARFANLLPRRRRR